MPASAALRLASTDPDEPGGVPLPALVGQRFSFVTNHARVSALCSGRMASFYREPTPLGVRCSGAPATAVWAPRG